MGPLVCSLVSAGVFMCVLHLAPVQAQCTRRHYGDDDDNNNNENFLVAMMGHLRDTVDQLRLDHDRSTNQLQQQFNHTTENLRQEQQRSTKQLQQQLNHTVEQLRQEQQRSTKQLQQQFNHTADQLRQDQQSSTEQLRQLFNHAMVDQQKQLTSIEKRLTTVYASDCADLLKKGYRTSGVYYIYLMRLNKKIKVFCDQDTENGGWTVFQKRQDGSVDFYRYWKNYKEGFGDLDGEFWLGNDYLHAITSQANYTLRVDLTAFNGSTRYAKYTTFAVAAESTNYTLSVRGYHGTAGDSMSYNNGAAFSTKDRDNDKASYNCASSHVKGAWWFEDCSWAYLNGVYLSDGSPRTKRYDGITWYHWLGMYRSLQRTEMKIRP